MKGSKINQILVGIGLIVGVNFSHYALANWTTTSNNNCKIFNAAPTNDDSATWSGECKDGYAHGYGTVQWYENNKLVSTITVNYIKGKRNGKGFSITSDGYKYEGDFKDNQRTGLGIQTIPKTKKTKPMMEFLMLHGKKIEQQKGSYVIRGYFVDGENVRSMTAQEYENALKAQAKKEALEAERVRKEAEAKAKAEQAKREAEQKERDFIASFKACTPTGNHEYFGSCDLVGTDKFVGISLTKQNGKYTQMTCHNGQPANYDTMISRLTKDLGKDRCWKALHLIPNSCELDDYRGQCNSNKQPHGIGYHYKSPHFYTGTFVNGKKEGVGIQTFTNTNNRYEGEWLGGYYHGKGTMTYKDGAKYIGDWKNDKQNGHGTYTFADGRKYVGDWKDNKKDGKGTFTWTNGKKYTGNWKNDYFHGFGTISYAKGGDFDWYKERGYGSLQGDRYIVEGEWENDNFIAICKPNRQACDKGREIHRKKEAEIAEKERLVAQKQAEAEEKRRRAEQAQEPSMFFVNFSCTACEAQILSLSTPSGTSPTFTNSILDKQVGVYRLSNNSSFKGTYHFRVQLTKWGGQDIQICSGSFTKNDNTKEAGFLIDYYSCNISKIH